MLHLYDRATIAHALTLDLDPRLQKLLAASIGTLDDDLLDCTGFFVVQPGDKESDIIRHIGLSPLIEPIDGARFGDTAEFNPHWDWLAAHDGYWELHFTFGSSFAYVVIVADEDGVIPDLRRMCALFATSEF